MMFCNEETGRLNRSVGQATVGIRSTAKMLGWLAMVLVLALCGAAGIAQAETDDVLPGGDTYISGNSMVWYANDAKGQRQIYYKNTSTGQTKQITDTSGYKTFPKVSGDLVVWQEKREAGPTEPDWEIYAYHVPTGVEKKLSTEPGNYIEPTTDGRYVAWHNNNINADMYVYDWAAGTLKQIGKGRYPIVAQGNLLFKQQFGNALDLYRVTTGETKTVLPDSKTEYVNWFAFNGETALYVMNSIKGETKFAMMNVQEAHPTSKDLTPYTKKKRDFAEMVVGDNYVAWMEDKDGVAQVMAASIRTGQTEQLTHGTTDQRPLAMIGNKLLYSKDFYSISKVAVSIGQTQTESGRRGGGTAAVISTPQPSLVKGTIGPDGGKLQSDGAKAMIEFAKGSLNKPLEFTLRSGVETDTSALGQDSELELLSDVWEITVEEKPEGSGSLTLAFDGTDLESNEMKKPAIYRYDSEKKIWSHIGGRVSEASQTVRADLSTAGTYAVLIHRVVFRDMDGHWARQPVEVLASRWIVNGMAENTFYPDEKLTRAQFTKMLSASLGIVPIEGETMRFADVTKEHWGYGWIEAAARAGLVEGDGGGFQPDAELTREQMMAMLIRAVEKGREMDLSGSASNNKLSVFSDAGNISPWAKEYAEKAVLLGLVEGNEGKLLPGSTSTRAEAATVMYRLLIKQDKL